MRDKSHGLIALGLASLAVLGCAEAASDSNDEPSAQVEVIDVWNAAASSRDRLTLLVPPGDFPAIVMQLSMPRRAFSLGERLKEGMRADPQATFERLGQRKPGEPLPYDPDWGLTREEFGEFSEMMNQWRLRKSDVETRCTVNHPEVGTIVLSLPANEPKTGELEINIEEMTVTTPFGHLSDPRTVNASVEQHVTGPLEWILVEEQ